MALGNILTQRLRKPMDPASAHHGVKYNVIIEVWLKNP